MSHLYDSWDLNYKTPFGAVKKGKVCFFFNPTAKRSQTGFFTLCCDLSPWV